MAPISRSIVLAAWAVTVSAIPLNMPRQQLTDVVTETTWTTMDQVVTLWVDENGNPISTDAPSGIFATVTMTPTSSTVDTTPTATIAQASSPAQPPSPSTTFLTSTASVNEQQVAAAAPAVSTTTVVPAPAPAPAAVTSSPAVVYSAPSSSAAAPVASVAAANSGNSGSADASTDSASSTNSCEGAGAACLGDITYWEGGVGACGWNVNTNSDMQIALPWEFMGTLSNSNPYCGRSLTIKNPTTGQTAQATVGDKCMGCTDRSIDLTSALFTQIGGGCNGRCSNFEWWFN